MVLYWLAQAQSKLALLPARILLDQPDLLPRHGQLCLTQGWLPSRNPCGTGACTVLHKASLLLVQWPMKSQPTGSKVTS